ncbi:coiled coil protein [Legionella gratiana]|uniref:Coiled coil protein n=1 Tax=Legionella gratiana TaxID=45066 RepID=A0A378J4F1_9GAMM|nr:hypothetical protein [Legionella gratiana]KTD14584.1 coiled coil protein [Legionella gratiana]STX41787.1 coiled coil protein [Legionella gratiana]
MYILERLLALFLGIIVVPLRVLACHLLYAMIALLIGVCASIGIPLSLALTLNYQGMSKAVNIPLTLFFVFPMTAVLITSALVLLASYFLYSMIIHTVEALWLGFKNSLFYGMDGFWNTLSTQQIVSQDVWNQIRAFLGLDDREELNEAIYYAGDQRIAEGGLDLEIVDEDFEILDLQSKEPREPPILFDEIELKKIEELMEYVTNFKEPLAQLTKEQFIVLQTLYTQYQDLFSKLEEVRFALIDNEKSKIKDELIAYNKVNIPILLVKQYKKGERWYHVPASSYVTDKESFLHLLKKNPMHPLIRDRFKKPEPYHHMETRYLWYELTENDCSSQELSDAVVEIRVLVDRLLSQLSETQRINFSMWASCHAFFGSVTGGHAHTRPLEQNTRLYLKCT